MTERIHPEDLRALVAATMWGDDMSLPGCLKMADTLLTELARTAKPDAPRLHACHDCQQAEAEARDRLAEAGEHILASDAAIARLNAELAQAQEDVESLRISRDAYAEMRDKALAENREGHAAYARLSEEKATIVERVDKIRAEARKDAAWAEQVRIISLLTNDLFSPVAACQFNPAEQPEKMVGEILTAAELHAALSTPVQP
ncbi:MAG TPA: hypothetical protein VN829_04440 [Dongiaceae bacterium]|nr:hypothetical protein [Dongiaceae bacterium]